MSAFLRTASRAVARPALAARTFSSTAKRDVAKITIVGNLADTPELRASSTGREYLRYSVASNTGSKENRTTSWFNVTSFQPEGPQRDFLASLGKGTLVMVDGDASISTYTDAEGKARQSLNIVQRSLEVLRGGRSNRGEEGGEHH
ncbi:single-stranded DNA-binding protein rim1, mitochondrial [Podospora fimiseda]|uniref:Single-stranded DNA-binding protein rim1, mitochondrial n=1 Tax=Podospora fimiseda TaxID=252190 RepID=A0AAN7GVE8_9PEZI|nr:single-stranded DNA-binding protein rim1, mitochondrial [Podospora fimiseda]